MLPRNGGNLGENLARARRRKGGRLSHSLLLIEDRSPLRPLSFVGFRPGRGRSMLHPYAKARRHPAAASACSRSAIKSSTSSIPTDNRTRLSVSPIARRISGRTLAWVLHAGCPTRLSTPPSDSARRSEERRVGKA